MLAWQPLTDDESLWGVLPAVSASVWLHCCEIGLHDMLNKGLDAACLPWDVR
jgi:hypothetical protein